MRFIILALLLVSTSAFARVQWPDVEIGQTYKLSQEFKFPSGFTLPKGEEVVINDLSGIGMGLVLLDAQVQNCTFPELELSVKLFYVPTAIGLTVQPGCVLWFYVELSDLYTEAPLE